MKYVKTLVIGGLGTNSHQETAYAAKLAGSDEVDLIHFNELLSSTRSLDNYQFLIFPGGFLDGDDLGAAQTAAIRWKYSKNASNIPLLQNLRDFIDQGGLILGICNGFQLLVKLGLLPGNKLNAFSQQISLGTNTSAKFENRWVNLKINPHSNCVFTQNLSFLKLPVRHGEGRVVIQDREILKTIEEQNQIALTYAHPESSQTTMQYPHNPNGSILAIAGLTDPSGKILGLMPHPEAFHHFANHPAWTRKEISPPGTLLFANAIKYIRENL